MTRLPSSSRMSQRAKSELRRLEVHYDTSKLPIIIERTNADPLLSTEIAEAARLTVLGEMAESIHSHVGQSRQIVSIEVDRDNLTEDAWSLCDCLESFIASHLNGIVYAPGDGFYDERLAKIASVDRSENGRGEIAYNN